MTTQTHANPIQHLITANVQRYMAARKLSCNALAKAAGIPQPNLHRILRGTRRWTLNHLAAVAAALHVPTADLVADPNQQPTTKKPRRTNPQFST
jgi:antitoxin component HigA of HigAB toxin-antitoxin module